MCTLTPQDRAFAARTLAYEVGVLVQAPEYWSKASACGDQLGKVLALESALLHARTVYDFFFTEAVKDDITARDFVDAWNRSKELTPCYVKKHRDRINKMLAHMTRARLEFIRAGQHEWDLALIRWELVQVFLRFLENCPAIASIIESELLSRFSVSLAELKAMPKPSQ